MHHHHEWHATDARDRRDVADEIEVELVVKRRVDRVVATTRRSVWPSAAARTTASVAMLVPAPGRFSMTNGWPKLLRKPLTRSCAQDVLGAARSKSDNDAYRPRRVGLRPRDARHGRERGGARCQMQKLATGKFHGDDPSSTFSRGYHFSTRQQIAAAQYLDPSNARLGSFSTKFSGVCLWPLPLSPKSGHSASARFMSTRPSLATSPGLRIWGVRSNSLGTWPPGRTGLLSVAGALDHLLETGLLTRAIDTLSRRTEAQAHRAGKLK